MPNGWHRASKTTPAAQARARKYASPEHRAYRKTVQAHLDDGKPVSCWRCGHSIPNNPKAWHVGHDDAGQRIMGPEHSGCNLRAASRKGARIANARRKTQRLHRAQSRAW